MLPQDLCFFFSLKNGLISLMFVSQYFLTWNTYLSKVIEILLFCENILFGNSVYPALYIFPVKS
jgi:hypothetical protein